MNRTQDETLIYNALSCIETPNYDIAAAVARRHASKLRSPLHPLRRGLVLALVGAVLACSLGAAAVTGISGMWGDFFGHIPANAISTVGVSQTAGDYTLTIEDAIVANDNAMLLLSLRRADGGQINPNAHLRTNSLSAKLLVDGERVGSDGFEGGTQRSEDGTTLYFCFEASHHGTWEIPNLVGATLTLEADGVGIELYNWDGYYFVLTDPISLAPLAGLDLPDWTGKVSENSRGETQKIIQSVEAQNIMLPLPRSEEFPDETLRGAVITDDGLSLVITQKQCRSGDLVCTAAFPETLIDTRDGTQYNSSVCMGGAMTDGTWAMLCTFQDCPLTAEDLPYLELVVGYELDQILSDEPFSLDFTTDSTSAVTLTFEAPVTVNGVELHPTEMRLSALDASIGFEDGLSLAVTLYTDGSPVLHMADGTEIALKYGGGAGSVEDGPCTIHFSAKDENDERIFFDTRQIQSITFGDLELTIS